jgi:hypothetical protein
VKKLSPVFLFFIMAESTERELYGDLRAITGHQKSKFLLHFESSCIVITRPKKLARAETSTLARTCVGAGSVKNIKGVSHLLIS